jgi:hypothetical protein
MSDDPRLEEWAADWREPVDPWLAGARTTAAEVHRSARRSRLLELVLALGCATALALAVWHASNVVERIFAGGVILAIGVLWARRRADREREVRALLLAEETFLAATRALRQSELRLARFVLALSVATSAFFLPWWWNGREWHAGAAITSRLVVIAFWIPAIALLLLVAWSIRLWRRARGELRAMEEIGSHK